MLCLYIFILILVKSVFTLHFSKSSHHLTYESSHNYKKVNKLVNENYKFVPWLAKKYVKKHSLKLEEKEEMIQEGYLGLIRACQKFDTSYNTKITTYSKFWIERFMTNYIIQKYKKSKINIVYDDTVISHQIYYDDSNKVNYTEIIGNLPIINDYEKDLIYKRYVQKMRVQDISLEYDVCSNTIANHFKKIRLKLREYYKI